MVYESVEQLMASDDIMSQVSDVWTKSMTDLNINEKATVHAVTALLRTDPSIIMDIKRVSTEGSVGHELKRCYVKDYTDDWDPSCARFGLEPTTIVFINRDNGLHQDYGQHTGPIATIMSTRRYPFTDLTDNDRAILLRAGVRTARVWHEQENGDYKFMREFKVEPITPKPQVQESNHTYLIISVLLILVIVIVVLLYITRRRQ